MTTPGCLDTLADFRKKYDGQVMVGCGTVMTTIEAEQAMDAGAEFIISPILIPDVITWCVARNIVCVPGCQTPTELYEAHKLGAPIQKVCLASPISRAKAIVARSFPAFQVLWPGSARLAPHSLC